MGIELVKLASHHHRRLSGNAFKVLTAMCLAALDRPTEAGRPARLYFGGWEPLAFALGHDVPADDGTAAVRAARARSQEYVRRAVADLARGGAVERMTTARQGERQVYRLTFPAPLNEGGSSPTETVPLSPTEKVPQEPHRNSGPSPAEKVPPRKDLGGTQDLRQDDTPIGGLSSHRLREPVAPHAFPLGEQSCDRCPLPAGNVIHREAS